MKKRIFLTPKCDECGHDEFEYDSSFGIENYQDPNKKEENKEE
mgnify:CR=1 FL=1